MDNEMQQTNPEWYKDLLYQDVKVYIRDNINSASRSFVAIGYYLKYVRDNQLFLEDGYATIWEFAQGEFSIGKSSASSFMSINDKFSVDGNSPILLEQYRDFTSSKLAEMLTLSEEQLEQVTPVTTRAEIREMKQPVKEIDTVLHAEQKAEELKTIDDLDFSINTYNCLKRAGIDTIDELCELTRNDVIGIRNISHKCLDEIYMKLSGIGRCLKEEIRNESIDSEPEDNDDKIPDPDLSCKFDLEARCLIASKESCKRSSDEGCMNCSGSWGEEDYITVEPEHDKPDPVETVEADIVQSEQIYEPEQPELPILRNNDQRKEFIEVYATWPIWIDQELTGERYYRYDFNNGDSMVVKVYYCKVFDYKSTNLTYEERFRDDWGKEEYYLLEPDKYFKDCETNKSALVDYLKEIQKKGG